MTYYDHDQPNDPIHSCSNQHPAIGRLFFGPGLEEVVAPQQPHVDQTVEVIVWIRDAVVAFRLHPTGPGTGRATVLGYQKRMNPTSILRGLPDG